VSAQYLALVDAYANTRDRLDGQAIAAVRKALTNFSGWYSDAQVRDMAAGVVKQIEATQRQTANLTNSYLARVAEAVVGKAVRPVPIVVPSELREGADHVAVYERLGAAYRFAASQGASPAEALATTLARGVAMGQMDNLLAFRGQTSKFMQSSDRISGYRRVIRPERSRSGTCGLCAVASDKVYRSGDLMPIHERCNCSVLPIAGGKDPGRTLNVDEYKAITDAAGSDKGIDLAKVRVEVHQHGELGPVLRPAGQHFRGPSEVAAAA
jgi:hypothetical protein